MCCAHWPNTFATYAILATVLRHCLFRRTTTELQVLQLVHFGSLSLCFPRPPPCFTPGGFNLVHLLALYLDRLIIFQVLQADALLHRYSWSSQVATGHLSRTYYYLYYTRSFTKVRQVEFVISQRCRRNC